VKLRPRGLSPSRRAIARSPPAAVSKFADSDESVRNVRGGRLSGPGDLPVNHGFRGFKFRVPRLGSDSSPGPEVHWQVSANGFPRNISRCCRGRTGNLKQTRRRIVKSFTLPCPLMPVRRSRSLTLAAAAAPGILRRGRLSESLRGISGHGKVPVGNYLLSLLAPHRLFLSNRDRHGDWLDSASGPLAEHWSKRLVRPKLSR
jgi:hypothetical protein